MTPNSALLRTLNRAALAPSALLSFVRFNAGERWSVSAPMRSLILAALLLSACFPFEGGSRDLPGPYELERSEDGETFWVNGPGAESDGGGILHGAVTQVGWSQNHIVAYRKSTFRGDPDGWMVIDVEKQTVAGPLSDVELRKVVDIQGITLQPATEAWKRR